MRTVWTGLRRGATPLAIATAILAGGTTGASAQAPLDFDDLTDEVRRIVDGSGAATLQSLGTSQEGRDIWMVQIAANGAVSPDDRPGVLVVANLSADHLIGSTLAVEALRYLTGTGAAEADLTEHVLYVVPRLNPDGAEAVLNAPPSGRRGNVTPYDDDNDGRVDENPPSDLNGDGVVTTMRVPDALGVYMVDPDDDRLMKLADAAKGERGTHTLYWEGRDTDGDGFIGEDRAGGVDLDRNFQHEYPYWEADAGLYMVSEQESRALMNFVIARRNIAAVVTFGHSDNLVTPPNGSGALAGASGVDLLTFAGASLADVFDSGVFAEPFQQGRPRLRGAQPGADNDPSSGRRPEVTVQRDDREYFNSVSEAYREITGIEEIALNRTAQGAFFQYGYYHFGVPSFSTPGWALPETDDEDAPGEGDGRLLAAFESGGIDAWVPWTAYNHADLGSVEIGGFRHDALVSPDLQGLAESGAQHGAFVARLSSMLARVRIADVSVEAHGGGIFTVTADVTNEGYFPSALRHGTVSRSVDPVLVQIQVDPTAILTGATKSHRIQTLAGSGGRERVSWVIRGNSGRSVEITVRSEKGGSDTRTVTLGGDR